MLRRPRIIGPSLNLLDCQSRLQYIGSTLRKQIIHLCDRVLEGRVEEGSPELALSHVRIDWTEKELTSLAKLLSSEPPKPTDALIRAVRG